MDNFLHRQTIVDSRHHHTRTTQLPVGISAALTTSSGNVLVNRRDPGDYRSIIQLLSPSGQLIRTFLDRSPDGTFQSGPSELALARDGSIYTVRKTHVYQISRWAESGELIQTITPVRDWFPPYTAFVPPDGPGSPTPAIAGIWLDAGRSLLWVFGIAPDTTRANPATGPSTIDYEERLDGIIDIFDLRSSALFASGRFNSPFFLVSNDGLVASFDSSPPEGPTVNIFEVSLNSLPR
jgi:hypothetical protein